ncbi:universal stress protein [Rhodococcus coprophilus]|uniref:universal stress protein n=1 Tax=Rhodococcus coprophilus TaxID=38310 RepID=UPI0009352E19|nr:universal stress protein [Rhodococcus coprophilus]MBM7457945.1 nucleotide-binding universal stress UspA family protein [Rhodococcus coprophilus]
MTTPSAATHDRNRVTVGVDGSPPSEGAVRWAATTAAGRGLTLHLVHAVDFSPASLLTPTPSSELPFFRPSEAFEWAEEDANALLTAAAETARAAAPDVHITTDIALTGSAKWLVELSHRSAMVVLGATGSTRLGELLVGSTPVAVVGHSACPVVVVRGAAPPVPDDRPVVVGVDGSALSEMAVEAAFEEASWRGVDLVAVHVWTDMRPGDVEASPHWFDPVAFEESEQALVSECLAGFGDRFPDVTVHRKTYVDGPRAHLKAWSEKAQLVVVGSRGRGGFAGLLMGSTSNTLLREAACPVMVVRPEAS